jgi:hypothetical protein
MNLKEKLCILKNYTLLLLDPSPFEHWLESYLYITVRSLCFLLFATGSSIVFPEPSIFSVPLRARVTAAAGRSPEHLQHGTTLNLFHASSYPSSHRHAVSAVLPLPLHVGQSTPGGCHAPPVKHAGATRRLELHP